MRLNLDQTLREYWVWRLGEHFGDRYKGRQLVKMPEDLRTYQKVIEETRPNVIVEFGTWDGGSAMWLHDQMVAIVGSPALVITVDWTPVQIPKKYPNVIAIKADLRGNGVLDQIKTNITAFDRVMVIDDSAHTYDVTSAVLRLYSDLVTPGCYFVVEDGVVDEPELSIWPSVQGVQPAIVDFLATEPGKSFTREWKDEFGLTMHMGGWLRKGEA